jgi:hypothetical protein
MRRSGAFLLIWIKLKVVLWRSRRDHIEHLGWQHDRARFGQNAPVRPTRLVQEQLMLCQLVLVQ